MRSFVDFYLTTMRTQISQQFQYRAAAYMYLLGMVAEPVIYLVVWTTIAEDSGGTVGGLTTGELAAYYIVWTFVRNMGLVFTPYGWEWRIREGELSGHAAAAAASHPLRHRRLRRREAAVDAHLPADRRRADAGLRPDVRRPCGRDRGVRGRHLGRLPHPVVQPVRARAHVLLDDARGRGVLALHHGRAAALGPARPDDAHARLGADARVGSSRSSGRSSSRSRRSSATYSNAELLRGLGMQVFWILVGIGIFSLVWRRAIRHYTAVGN